MLIEPNMNLRTLAALLGRGIGEPTARGMRDQLVARYDGRETWEVPHSDWAAMRHNAIRAAHYQGNT
jgi:hypothetical protein